MGRSTDKPKLALWFRYGPAEHAELFHALPGIIAALAEHFDVYYIGFTSREKPDVPAAIRDHAHVIQLPITISRRDTGDKTKKTILWIALTPLLAAGSWLAGIRYVYVDETLPLVMPIGRLFFRNRITMTLADLFLEQYLSKGALKKFLQRIIFGLDCRAWRAAPLVFTRSISAGTHLSRLGLSPERIHYAYDAIDESIYHPYDRAECRRLWGWTDEEIVMVYHGVLNPAKDLDTVLDALPDVVRPYPHFRFLIIGNGPDEGRLREKVSRLGLDRQVQFAGYVEPRRVATALGGGDIGLISRKADLGSQLVITSVLGHCLACGMAVLAARTDGIAELITDGESGLLFTPGDVREFREKLLRLCGDSDLRTRLAQAGQDVAQTRMSLHETITRNTEPIIRQWGAGA